MRAVGGAHLAPLLAAFQYRQLRALGQIADLLRTLVRLGAQVELYPRQALPDDLILLRHSRWQSAEHQSADHEYRKHSFHVA